MIAKISDYDGYPGSTVDCKTKFTIKESSLIMPPEYLDDETYTNKGDTWQLGLLLYHLITLNPLFTAKTESRLLK